MNEFCRDVPFSMDNASKIAEVAWEGVYIFILESFGKESVMCLQYYPLGEE